MLETYRTVIVYTHVYSTVKNEYTRVEDFKGYARFHSWGCDYTEFESGPANFSTAIIEREDGTVENVPIDTIKFIDGASS